VTTAAGTRFPARDLIIIVISGVIPVPLLLQDPTLPAVLRWVRLPDGGASSPNSTEADRTATEAAPAAHALHPPSAGRGVRWCHTPGLDSDPVVVDCRLGAL
jgi:CPA1 family monovalent cation:H+ antiporter